MMKALIPFRKGSERVKDKNIRPICGMPLYEYSLDVAIRVFNDVIVATDYDYSSIRTKGKGLLYMRNVELYKREDVGNTQTSADLFMELFAKGLLEKEDDVCLLQPTSPIRLVSDLENTKAMWEANRSEYNTLISVQEIDSINKLYAKHDNGVYVSLTGSTEYDRFKANKLYARNSSIYIFKMSYFLETLNIFERTPLIYIMPKERSIDIDTEEDFKMAEMVIKGGVLWE